MKNDENYLFLLLRNIPNVITSTFPSHQKKMYANRLFQYSEKQNSIYILLGFFFEFAC